MCVCCIRVGLVLCFYCTSTIVRLLRVCRTSIAHLFSLYLDMFCVFMILLCCSPVVHLSCVFGVYCAIVLRLFCFCCAGCCATFLHLLHYCAFVQRMFGYMFCMFCMRLLYMCYTCSCCAPVELCWACTVLDFCTSVVRVLFIYCCWTVYLFSVISVCCAGVVNVLCVLGVLRVCLSVLRLMCASWVSLSPLFCVSWVRIVRLLRVC